MALKCGLLAQNGYRDRWYHVDYTPAYIKICFPKLSMHWPCKCKQADSQPNKDFLIKIAWKIDVWQFQKKGKGSFEEKANHYNCSLSSDLEFEVIIGLSVSHYVSSFCWDSSSHFHSTITPTLTLPQNCNTCMRQKVFCTITAMKIMAVMDDIWTCKYRSTQWIIYVHHSNAFM